jgi:hypothetical protein
MIIYKNKYRDHWLSPYKICEKICFWREIDYDEPWVKTINKVLEPACNVWRKFLDVVHPKIDYVKIDKWDTWSMDSTLSPIILPMLKQLKQTKHGSPYVEDADVPARLRSKPLPIPPSNLNKNPDVHKISEDPKLHRRWDWVLDEMIWTFEQLCDEDNDSQFHTGEHDIEWVPSKVLDAKGKPLTYHMAKGPNDTSKFDKKGYTKHHERIDNGLKLFGKYFRALWD